MLPMLLREENISNSVGGPGRHEHQVKDPQASAQIVKWGNYPSQRHCGALICNVGQTEGQRAPEVGRPASPRPPSLRVQASESSNYQTDTQRQSETSRRRQWPDGHTLRLAGLRGAIFLQE